MAIARAIALNPQYLFCDEPNSGLDPKTSLVIDALIQDITREYDMTTLINTQSRAEHADVANATPCLGHAGGIIVSVGH